MTDDEPESIKLVIHSIDYIGSVVDGPGIRAVLFLQGCEQRCTGCHNPETWERSGGITWPIDELICELRERVHNRKLTVSGGEPLLQSEAVIALVKGLPEFNIALYTGLEYEDVSSELLKYIDYLKVGGYRQEHHCTTMPFVGSSNQSFITVKGDAT